MRIAQIITTELAAEKLKLEYRLEDTINSDRDINVKTNIIKETLKEIALVETIFAKAQQYLQEPIPAPLPTDVTTPTPMTKPQE